MAELDDAAIRRDLERLNENGNTFIAIEDLPSDGASFIAQDQLVTPAAALQFTGDTRQSWHMTSFSGLSTGSAHGKEYRVELPDHDQVVEERALEIEPGEVLSPFTFPRGAQAGLFLHHLFENIPFKRSAPPGRKRLELLPILVDVITIGIQAISIGVCLEKLDSGFQVTGFFSSSAP